MGKHLVLSALVFALAQTDASCATTSTGGPGGGSTSVPGGGTATTTCPIPAPYTVHVAVASDISSVTVPPGSTAIDEANGGVPWCDTTQVSVTKLSVSGSITTHGCPNDNIDKTLPCDEKDMLMAIELKPTPVRFPVSGSQPELKYDLQANPPLTGCESGCTLDVYQLRVPKAAGEDNWRWVAEAARGLDGSIPVARANVNHFSVFALVEHPAPVPAAAGDVSAQFVVSSDFLQVDEAVVVQLSLVEDGFVAQRELLKEMSLLFRFDRVDPARGFDDPACPGDVPAILTCLFPIESQVLVELQPDQLVSITDVRTQTRVDFSATVAIT